MYEYDDTHKMVNYGVRSLQHAYHPVLFPTQCVRR